MTKYYKIFAGLLGGIFLSVGVGQMSAASLPENIDIAVPFTAQAPLGEWRDVRQQDGCEEAVAAMAMAWVGGEKDIAKADWRLRILILSTFENKKYGEYRDVALADMVAWLFNDYFRYQKVAVKTVASAADIIKELEKGNLVLTPMDGRLLKNPYYTEPGPERHMILIKGYDYKAKQFITNDPGTRRGEGYRYKEEVLFRAIRDYQTGHKLPFGSLTRSMIVVSK
ncbi:MAG: C39 family peptidase [Patescibacteria group bacterium]